MLGALPPWMPGSGPGMTWGIHLAAWYQAEARRARVAALAENRKRAMNMSAFLFFWRVIVMALVSAGFEPGSDHAGPGLNEA